MRFVIGIIIMLAVIFGANFYVFFRLWHILPAGKTILVCIGIFIAVSPIISLGLGNYFPSFVSAFMHKVGTSWIIILLYLVILFVLLDLARVTCLLSINRFMFNSWTGFGILALFVTVLMTLGYINYRNKKRVELTINVDKKLETDVPVKIVAISDLHLGYGIGPEEFRRQVQLINREKPDVLLIAGDAIDNSLKPLYEKDFATVFGEIRTKYGIYFAPGNHEYISGIDGSINFLTRAGVTVLRDSAAVVGNAFYVAGRDDRSNPARKTLLELTASLDKSKLVIVLDHQPYHLEEVEKNSIDLQISGHTHAGQVLPVSWIVSSMYEIAHGYLKKGNSHIYVSSGFGIFGGKFRIGTRSEYVVININQFSE